MTKLLALFHSDLKQSFFWLKKHTIAKMLVFFASLGLLFGLVSVIFSGSFYYFWSIKLYEPYGQITSSYVLHSGLIITAWLVFLSSLVQTLQMLSKPSKELIFQMTQPVHPLIHSTWITFRLWWINTLLMMLLWLPVAFSFNAVYGSFSKLFLLGSIILITGLVTALIQVLATTITLIFAPLAHYGKNWVPLLATAFLLGLTWHIINFIFPLSLRDLLRVDIAQFDQLFKALPLNQPGVLSGNIINFLETRHLFYLVKPLSLLLAVSISGLIINSLIITRSWQKILSIHHKNAPISPPLSWWYKKPHILKEILLLFRNNTERNALGLFLGLLIFFFYFLQRSLHINQELIENSSTLAVFSLGAVLFIATAFLLRLVFPLLSKEGTSAWYLLRESSSSQTLYYHKVGFAKYLITLLVIVINIGWLTTPFPSELKQNLMVFSTIGLLLIGWLITALGMMVFEWEKGDQPDQISTSGTGLVTLALSLCITGGIMASFLELIPAYWHAPLLIIVTGGIISIHRLSEKRSNRYQYPQNWN